MEDFPIIHYSGNPQQDSTDDVRMNYIVNQRTSQAGSSSCQCLTTFYGMQKAMMNYVLIIQRQLKSMLIDSLPVIGLS